MDPAARVIIPAAFFAGLISFLSPCVLPLVPGYLSTVAGVQSTDQITARKTLGPTLAFIASFSAIFISLGLLGQRALRGALTGQTALHVCGAIIIAMGILFIATQFVPRLSRSFHVEGLIQSAGNGGPILVGAAFAIAWTPCTGPTLGAIIAATGTSDSALHGALLLAFYCLGLGVPFLITGLAFGRATSAFTVIKRFYPLVITLGGLVLIVMGVMIWTGEFTTLNVHVSNWLRDVHLPNLSSDT